MPALDANEVIVYVDIESKTKRMGQKYKTVIKVLANHEGDKQLNAKTLEFVTDKKDDAYLIAELACEGLKGRFKKMEETIKANGKKPLLERAKIQSVWSKVSSYFKSDVPETKET